MSAKGLQWTSVVLLACVQLSHCVNLRIYSDDTTLKNYAEVALSNSETLLKNDFYNASRNNFIYSFGSYRTPDSDATIAVLREAVALKLYNVFLLDWQKEASGLSTITPTSLTPYIKQISLVVSGIPQAFHVGTQLGEELIRMSNAGFNLTKTCLAGHSLGAQLAGQAGRTAAGAGLMVERIYGVEPSGHGIYGRLMPSLNAGDARAVLCLHTDPGGYGINETLCHVDVMVNYKPFTEPDEEIRIQPGCPVGRFQKYSANDTCSHNRSWQIFAEGLRSPGTLVASRADNVWDWERGVGDCEDTLPVSIEWDITKRGVYYMATNPSSPYGMGLIGCCPPSH